MAEFAVYAKRTQPVRGNNGHIISPDNTFKPINSNGVRVAKKDIDITFATKEDAQEWIDSHTFHPGVVTEIRKL